MLLLREEVVAIAIYCILSCLFDCEWVHGCMLQCGAWLLTHERGDALCYAHFATSHECVNVLPCLYVTGDRCAHCRRPCVPHIEWAMALTLLNNNI